MPGAAVPGVVVPGVFVLGSVEGGSVAEAASGDAPAFAASAARAASMRSATSSGIRTGPDSVPSVSRISSSQASTPAHWGHSARWLRICGARAVWGDPLAERRDLLDVGMLVAVRPPVAGLPVLRARPLVVRERGGCHACPPPFTAPEPVVPCAVC
ncbi:hypothetical protein ACWV95_19185 [Streptomyces albus]